MYTPRLFASALALVLATASAVAQDKPMMAAPGQGPSGPVEPGRTAADPPDGGRPANDRPPVVVVEPEPRKPEGDKAQLDKVEPGKADADKAALEDQEELDRARAAARSADPRLQGIDRARAAARGTDVGGGKDCMSARDARGAIAQKRAVSLSQALRTARGAWDGEVIDYKLCTFDGALAYDLTLLNEDGRVARVRVEAASGKLVGVR